MPKAGSTSWTKNILKLVGTQYDFMNDINVDEEDRGFVLISKVYNVSGLYNIGGTKPKNSVF